MAEPWWKSAVFYQVYPRSFADSNGDGIGDLEGIRQRLDYLQWLGVDAIWICPFQPSPMADFGYDVSDYCDVDPIFGTLEDFDALLANAHDHGIRVISDWVPNHTSDQHPWFVESRSSRNNPKRDWYWWRDRPNNWLARFGGGLAWTFDEPTAQWYLHLFLPQQPDVNWRNDELAAAMHETLRFWLDRGIDGFRVDVVHGLGKDPDLTDDPPGAKYHVDVNDHPDAHRILKGLRQVTDAYPGERVLVGEVHLPTTRDVAPYFGRGDQLHLAFEFAPLSYPWEAAIWRAHLVGVAEELDPIGAWPTWTLSNHDKPRHRTRLGGSELRARAAALLLLTVRGTPFIYNGDELGLEDATVPPGREVDPGGRDPCRAPMPWDATPFHGWDAEPWLPWSPEPDTRNVQSLSADPDSILHLYRRLLAARRGSPALRLGSAELLVGPPGVVAYDRVAGDDRRRVVVNFTEAEVDVSVAGSWTTEVASDGAGEGEPFPGHLGGDAAVILRPRS